MTLPGRALVAVDLGTSSTCVAVGVPGEAPRVVVVDGGPLMSSAVYAEPGGLVVGAEADRRAALDPARYEPHPKRRVDEGSLLLGTAVVPVEAALGAVLGRAVAEARATLGGAPVGTLVLTHPADWGGVRTGVLRRAAAGLADELLLVPEPVAAAVLHGRDLAPGGVLAVLDVGGGTTDVTVLRRGRTGGAEVLATGGDPGFGGADLDEALLAALGRRQVGPARERWDGVLAGRGLDDRRRARALRADVRAAKESLSRHAFTDVPLPAGLPDAHVARDELEALAGPRVREVVALTARVLARAGALGPDGRSLAPVFLVGGSSRVPLVGREVHRGLGVVPVATDQPETVVARGAVLHAQALAAPRRPAAPAGVPAPAAPAPLHAADPPATTPRRRRRGLVVVGVLGVVAVLAVGGVALTQRGGPAAAAPATRDVVVGSATVPVPSTWREASRTDAPGTATGDTASVVLTPDGSRSAAVRLVLQQTVLAPGADAGTVVDALRTAVADAGTVSGTPRYSDVTAGVTYAGRTVAQYREQAGGSSVVDWSVLVEDRAQVSVGCQHDAADAAAVSAPCEAAVGGARTTAGR